MTYNKIIRFRKEIERTLFNEKCKELGISGSSVLEELAGMFVKGDVEVKGVTLSQIARENRLKRPS